MTWDIQNLRKSARDKMIGGVCGGLGEHSPVPGWVWRVGFASLVVAWGISVWVYLAMLFFMPPAVTDPDDRDAP